MSPDVYVFNLQKTAAYQDRVQLRSPNIGYISSVLEIDYRFPSGILEFSQ